MVLLSLFCGLAQAGALFVHAEVKAEVLRGDEPLLRTFGPTDVWLSNLPEGPHLLTVTRGAEKQVVEVTLAKEGDTRLDITAKAVSTGPVGPPPKDQPATWLHLDPTPGQRFALVVDGRRIGAFGPQQGLSLRGLAEGPHAIELRSADLTTVWARGSLALVANAPVQITATEGLPPTVKGATLLPPATP